MDLNSLQTTALRLSARLSENLSETARDLGLSGLDAASLAGAGSAGKYLEDGAVVTEDGVRETKKLLESRREASVAEGLRRVLAMMLKGRSVLTFFPQVVQCLSLSNASGASSNLQIRSLASLYIVRQAALEPDLALLPVNVYQKDLRDPNPVVRALALRTLAGMGLDSIAALVLMSAKTASRDTNWLVRRAAAEALVKLYMLDAINLPSLIPILESLLTDRHALVLGSALSAFNSICPDRIDILHSEYRRICRSLVDIDEWSQVIVLGVLERYARLEFADPAIVKTNPDLDLLLKCVEPLFYNNNPAVLLAAVRVTYRLGPASQRSKIVAPLLRSLQNPPEIQAIVLANIAIVASAYPTLFGQQVHRFYIIQSVDSASIRSHKLQILASLVNNQNIRTVLAELREYIKSTDANFVEEVVDAIGQCALRIASVRPECMKVLLHLAVGVESRQVASQALVQLHVLYKAATAEEMSTPAYTAALARLVLAFHNSRMPLPETQAQLFSLLAEFVQLFGENLAGPIDVLRVALKSFARLSENAKIALLLLSARLVVAVAALHGPPAYLLQMQHLHEYASALARFDPSWSIRDVNRLLSSMIQQGAYLPDELANGHDAEAQMAFSRGEKVASNNNTANGVDINGVDIAEKIPHVRTLITTVLKARSVPSSTQKGQADGSALNHTLQLVGWPALPGWNTKPPQHTMREPAFSHEETESFRDAETSGRIGSGSVKAASSRRKVPETAVRREKVVLIPTERDEYYGAPKARNLQSFLDESDEDSRASPKDVRQIDSDSGTSNEESESDAVSEDDEDEEDESESGESDDDENEHSQGGERESSKPLMPVTSGNRLQGSR